MHLQLYWLNLNMRINKSSCLFDQVSQLLKYVPTMAMFKDSRSLNTESRTILPSSDLIVVCAIWVIACSASSTPYDAKYGSNIFKYKTPSIFNVTLSLVIALCCGISITISFKLWTYFIESINGIKKLRPLNKLVLN
jgi:hypothetical protein